MSEECSDEARSDENLIGHVEQRASTPGTWIRLSPSPAVSSCSERSGESRRAAEDEMQEEREKPASAWPKFSE